MTMYINTLTGEYPVFEEDIKRLNPNVSFPIPFEAPTEYAHVAPVETPMVTPTQQCIEDTPVLVDGIYHQVWRLESADAELVERRKVRYLANLRQRRGKMLSDSDWIVTVSDAPMAPEVIEEWKTYRQALRDMINEEDPFSSTFPEKPKNRPIFRAS